MPQIQFEAPWAPNPYWPRAIRHRMPILSPIDSKEHNKFYRIYPRHFLNIQDVPFITSTFNIFAAINDMKNDQGDITGLKSANVKIAKEMVFNVTFKVV